jgi:murein tripeptide amidase MpaA
MANPDGVQQGNYRMNSNNINLNRVYNLSSPDE